MTIRRTFPAEVQIANLLNVNPGTASSPVQDPLVSIISVPRITVAPQLNVRSGDNICVGHYGLDKANAVVQLYNTATLAVYPATIAYAEPGYAEITVPITVPVGTYWIQTGLLGCTTWQTWKGVSDGAATPVFPGVKIYAQDPTDYLDLNAPWTTGINKSIVVNVVTGMLGYQTFSTNSQGKPVSNGVTWIATIPNLSHTNLDPVVGGTLAGQILADIAACPPVVAFPTISGQPVTPANWQTQPNFFQDQDHPSVPRHPANIDAMFCITSNWLSNMTWTTSASKTKGGVLWIPYGVWKSGEVNPGTNGNRNVMTANVSNGSVTTVTVTAPITGLVPGKTYSVIPAETADVNWKKENGGSITHAILYAVADSTGAIAPGTYPSGTIGLAAGSNNNKRFGLTSQGSGYTSSFPCWLMSHSVNDASMLPPDYMGVSNCILQGDGMQVSQIQALDDLDDANGPYTPYLLSGNWNQQYLGYWTYDANYVHQNGAACNYSFRVMNKESNRRWALYGQPLKWNNYVMKRVAFVLNNCNPYFGGVNDYATNAKFTGCMFHAPSSPAPFARSGCNDVQFIDCDVSILDESRLALTTSTNVMLKGVRVYNNQSRSADLGVVSLESGGVDLSPGCNQLVRECEVGMIGGPRCHYGSGEMLLWQRGGSGTAYTDIAMVESATANTVTLAKGIPCIAGAAGVPGTATTPYNDLWSNNFQNWLFAVIVSGKGAGQVRKIAGTAVTQSQPGSFRVAVVTGGDTSGSTTLTSLPSITDSRTCSRKANYLPVLDNTNHYVKNVAILDGGKGYTSNANMILAVSGVSDNNITAILSDYDTITVDRPWDVIPDSTSRIWYGNHFAAFISVSRCTVRSGMRAFDAYDGIIEGQVVGNQFLSSGMSQARTQFDWGQAGNLIYTPSTSFTLAHNLFLADGSRDRTNGFGIQTYTNQINATASLIAGCISRFRLSNNYCDGVAGAACNLYNGSWYAVGAYDPASENACNGYTFLDWGYADRGPLHLNNTLTAATAIDEFVNNWIGSSVQSGMAPTVTPTPGTTSGQTLNAPVPGVALGPIPSRIEGGLMVSNPTTVTISGTMMGGLA